MRHRDLANKLALWAWGKVITNEITELEKFILRGLEEISAQQPEDEVVEALEELYKYSCVAMDNHDHETQRAWKSTGFAEAGRKAKEILAKYKERK